MNRIKEALSRLTRSSREPRDGSTPVGPRLDRVGRTSSSAGSSRERISAQTDGRGPVIISDSVKPGVEGVDLVFVHGLFGARMGTWAKGGVCWPRDLLPHDVPNARIIAWGWQDSGANDTLSDQAENLLVDISRVRTGTKRPIIFIAHGIGGVLVKEALVTAALSRIYGSHAELANVYPRTIGCIFLGTPHGRSGKRSLGECAATTALISPNAPSPSLLRALKESSPILENQHSTFVLMSRDIRVICVREKAMTTIPAMPEFLKEAPNADISKGTMQLMVPKDAATYDNFNVTKEDFPTNHMDLVRFRGRDDPGYIRLVSHINQIASGPTQAELEALEPRNQEILNALYYDTMTEREDRIDRAYGQTCEWILSPKVSPFSQFLRNNEPILWISGKAGSGKSTLMKYAWNSEKMRQQIASGWAKDGELLMAAFFMFEGGSRIQKTYEGFLRSILYQLLSARRDLIKVAFPHFYDCDWPPPVQFTSWSNLNAGFYSLFAHMSERLRLLVFIDGIDEYRIMERKDHYEDADLEVYYDKEVGDESWGRSKWRTDSHAEIAKLITAMANKDTVKFVVTSRELPVFEDTLGEFPRIRLQEHTEKAIAQYVEGRLEDEAPGLPDTQNLCKEVAQKSQGDILWARLAIDILVDGSLRTLRSTLDSLPPQLGGPEGLYMRMMESLKPDYQNDACRIFHIILRSLQPPSLVTLAFTEQSYQDPSGQLRIDQDNARTYTVNSIQKMTDQMQRRLQICCAGLLEAEAGAGSGSESAEAGHRVVFTHQTTKEWVGRRDIWHRLPGVQPIDNTEIDLSLLSGCVRHLKAFETIRPPVLTWPNIRFRPEAWLLVANAMRYAERVDDELRDKDVRKYVAILDELDETNKRAWLAALSNYKPVVEDPDWYERKLPQLQRKHWSSFEPMEAGKPPKRKSFLSMVVQANLVRYTSIKLKEMDPETRQKTAQELLVYAVSPKADGFSACVSLSGDYLDFHRDMPASSLLDVLFEAGADPKEDDQIWIKALKAGRHYFSRDSSTMSYLLETWASKRLMQNRERWVAAVKKLLLHGANPNVELQVTMGTEEDRSTTTVAAVDLIRDTLEGEPDYALDLIELETLMGRRGSVGIAR
ncbi:hypothetical protein F4780DRAFT_540142 [Xylariomycetidae sp. FL0641]|nr:hypothetical protein F4780DRAFT_540142 [Xylariomycetidae sp. FL0641]